MIISEFRLNEIIKEVVPEAYQKNPKGPIRDIFFVPVEELVKIASSFFKGKDVSGVMGLCVDWNELLNQPGKDHFSILLSEDLVLEDELKFVLLHEVGHVDWHFNTELVSKFDKNEEELYADFFAHEVLVEKYGMDRAVDLTCRYGSSEGLRKKTENVK